MIALQRTARQIIVHHDGHSWQYDFPTGSNQPTLHSGSPQWAHAMRPADADALTTAAEASAIVLAKSIGIVPEFQTEGLSAEGIRVRDISSGHEFTFKVNVLSDEVRVLGSEATIHPDTTSRLNPDQIFKRARNYAEAEMMRKGQIDRASAV